jgi:hypothetical protein
MLPRSDAQRRFDALQAIICRSVSVPADAKAPKALVNIIIDQRSFEETLHNHGLGNNPTDLGEVDPSLRRSETSTGIALLPDVAVKAALTGHVRRVVVDSAGVVINMARKQRLFTGSTREAAKLMAYCCDSRGCDIPATSAEVDHITEWQQDGGPHRHRQRGYRLQTPQPDQTPQKDSGPPTIRRPNYLPPTRRHTHPPHRPTTTGSPPFWRTGWLWVIMPRLRSRSRVD